MSNVVIVAIPDENDRVWKVSSEKVPHLTLLFLGDEAQVSNLEQIVEFVQHAADTSLKRFYLNVDRRDELGPDHADVLFFRARGYDIKAVRDFRSMLLKDSNIKTAYDGAQQFEGPWQPHLTLGYPTAPAKEIPDDQMSSFYDVSFNKIAIWTGDFDGPEFLLKDYWDDVDLNEFPMDVAMSSISANDVRVANGLEALEHFGVTRDENGPIIEAELRETAMAQSADLGAEFLAHYGIKGMHWGQRTARPAPTAIAPSAKSVVPHGTKKKTKVQVAGGENHPAHEDAIKVAESRAKLAKSGTAALSNNELRDVANRIQLEQQVKTLTAPGGKKFVSNLLRNQGTQSANRVISRKAMAKGF